MFPWIRLPILAGASKSENSCPIIRVITFEVDQPYLNITDNISIAIPRAVITLSYLNYFFASAFAILLLQLSCINFQESARYRYIFQTILRFDVLLYV